MRNASDEKKITHFCEERWKYFIRKKKERSYKRQVFSGVTREAGGAAEGAESDEPLLAGCASSIMYGEDKGSTAGFQT